MENQPGEPGGSDGGGRRTAVSGHQEAVRALVLCWSLEGLIDDDGVEWEFAGIEMETFGVECVEERSRRSVEQW